MFGAVWVCMLALALPCWTYPSGHKTTCEEFGRGVTFDSVNAIGEWFTIYAFTGEAKNFTETITIRKLTASQLQQHEEAFSGYSKDNLKLEMKIHDSGPITLDSESVLVPWGSAGMVPWGSAGNVNAWTTHVKKSGTIMDIQHYAPFSIKWYDLDGFLVMMICENQKAFVLSKTVTPDEDKLQRVVDNLHIEGTTGVRIYSSLLTLL